MMNKFGLLNSDLETIVNLLKKQKEVEHAYIFGSRAKGNYKRGIDVDLALKGDQLNFEIVSQISYWLNEETNMPYKFDVLNYHSIQEEALKQHIDRIGVEFFTRDNS